MWAYDKKRASRDNQILKVPPEKRTQFFIAGEKSPKGERVVAVHAGQAALDEDGIARTCSLVRGKGWITNVSENGCQGSMDGFRTFATLAAGTFSNLR